MSTLEAKTIERPQSGAENQFEVIVIFTRAQTTMEAMKTAGKLAAGLRARIRVIVPQVIGKSGRSSKAKQFRLRTIVAGTRIETRLDLRPCADQWEMLKQTLSPGSIVILGGSWGWWPTVENRLARRLQASGHHVLRPSN